MLLSMTGYGRATQTHDGKTFTVELRSLNSKQNDLRIRTQIQLHKHEMELRRQVLDATKRGKLELTVEIADETGGEAITVNTALLKKLYHQVAGQTQSVQGSAGHEDGLYAALLRIPGVVESGSNRLADEDWPALKQTAEACIDDLNKYRLQEGKVLATDLSSSCMGIAELLTQVTEFEDARIQSVRDRMEKHLKDYLGRTNVDKNRYEQEVLFYLEKMDINEEKVRLKQNCEYFLEILTNKDDIKGRKLNFISQEIGREVNTLGAKAYSPEIQKLVVNMKEHLEMIKEQLANVA
ncbi:MAG: YicC/YloC family endoribonuclease [Bacteroidota bacterium]